MKMLDAFRHHLVEFHAVVSAEVHVLPLCRNFEDGHASEQEAVLENVALWFVVVVLGELVQVVVLEMVDQLNVQVSLVDTEVVLELSQEVDLQVELELHLMLQVSMKFHVV